MGPTDPAEAHFNKGLWGYDGSAWRKLQFLWGYYDTVAEQVYNLDAAAGSNALDGAVVPAGEVWVIHSAACTDSTNTCSEVRLTAVKSGVEAILYSNVSPVVAQYDVVVTESVLKAGDRIRARFYGVTALDNIWLNYQGYKMRVNL